MSDSEDEILFSSRCAMSNHLVIVHQNAKNSVALLKEMAEKETEKVQDTTSSATLNAMIQRFEKEEEQLAVQELFKKSSSYVSKLLFKGKQNVFERTEINLFYQFRKNLFIILNKT